MSSSMVYFGSARQTNLAANESLPAKLDLILDRLALRDRVKGETVAIKLHVGNHIGYSTVHPIFVRKVVQAIKEGGGKPFVADVSWDVSGAETRGYTTEVLGCPVYPAAGPDDRYFYEHSHPYKNIENWQLAGAIQDASFLVNFAHAKGHPTCGFGGVFKNLALGCMTGKTRGAMHDTMHQEPYWFREKCPDPQSIQAIIASCPRGALVADRDHPDDIHLHPDECNACERCLQVAPSGSLKIDPANFYPFQEACAISTSIVLSTFKAENTVHMALATHMTPMCDCFGFTTMPVLPDVGIFGSNDIVALEQAVLDAIGKTRLIEEALPTSMEVFCRQGHPFQWIHGKLKDPYLVVKYGEELGLGSRQYGLEDVLPVKFNQRSESSYIPAA